MNKKALITLLLALALPIVAWAQLESVKKITMKSKSYHNQRQVRINNTGQHHQVEQTY